MITVNGREMNLDGLLVKVERRRARGMLRDEELLAEGSLRSGLQLMPDLEARSYFGIQYRLQKGLALHGARLEPSLDLGRGAPAGIRFLGRLLAPWRKVKRKVITAPNEGYVKQQEQFNTFAVACLEATARIYHDLQWEGRGAREAAPDLRLRLEPLDEQAVAGLLQGTRGRLAFVGLPGAACLEKLLEKGRLEVGIALDDQTAARYQAAFLPVRRQEPAEFVRSREAEDIGALVVDSPDELSSDDLERLLRGAAEGLGGGAALLLRVSREGWTCPGGYARVAVPGGAARWTAEFLAWMMERHGFAVTPCQLGNACFLRGERRREGEFGETAARGSGQGEPPEGRQGEPGPRGEAPEKVPAAGNGGAGDTAEGGGAGDTAEGSNAGDTAEGGGAAGGVSGVAGESGGNGGSGTEQVEGEG